MVKLVPGRFYTLSGSKDGNSVGDTFNREVVYSDMFYIRDETINNQRWHVFFGRDEQNMHVRARIKVNEARTGHTYATTHGAVVTVALIEDRQHRPQSLNAFFDWGYALASYRQNSRDPRIKRVMEELWKETGFKRMEENAIA